MSRTFWLGEVPGVWMTESSRFIVFCSISFLFLQAEWRSVWGRREVVGKEVGELVVEVVGEEMVEGGPREEVVEGGPREECRDRAGPGRRSPATRSPRRYRT